MRKSIQNTRGIDPKADASAHRLDEFPTGYSLTGCSPALPGSASPAVAEDASQRGLLRGYLNFKHASGQLVC
jgi:hypothetical protein